MYNANNDIITTLSPTYLHIPEAFGNLNDYSTLNDYALITVAEDLSDYGMFKLAVARNSYITDRGSVIVSGFPQTYPPGYAESSWGLRFKATGNLFNYSSIYNIRYDADMTHGDSGGPVYVEEGIFDENTNVLQEYKSVIGINVAENSSYNTGVRITDDILKFYYNNDRIIGS